MLGNLVISPQSAHLTHNTEHLYKMDPYVRVIIGNQMQDSIVAKNFHKEPYWRGEMAFVCTKDQVINFEIWDKCSMGKDRLIGSCSLTLAGLADNYFFDWLPIYHKNEMAGQFLVCIHFYPSPSRSSEGMMSTQPMRHMMDSGYRTSGPSMNQSMGSNMGMMRSSNMGTEYQMMNQGMRMQPSSYEMGMPMNRMSPMMNSSRSDMRTMGSMNRMTPMQSMDPMMSRNTGMDPMMGPMSSERGMYGSMNRMTPMRPMSNEMPMNRTDQMRTVMDPKMSTDSGMGSMRNMTSEMKTSSSMGMMNTMNQMSRNMGMGSMNQMTSKMTPLSTTPTMSPGRMSTGMGSMQNLGTDMMSGMGKPVSSEMGMMNTMNKMMPMTTPNSMSMGMNPMGMNPMGNMGNMGSMGTEMEKMYLMNKLGMNPMSGSNMGSKFMGSEMNPMSKMSSEMGSMTMNPMGNMTKGMGPSSGSMNTLLSDLEKKTNPNEMRSNLMPGQEAQNVTGQMSMGGPVILSNMHTQSMPYSY